MNMSIKIGSRESKLAVIQSEMVYNYIREKMPNVEVKIVTMKTTGDIILDRPLDKIGGKGLFVKELDKALLEGRTDLSVHSLKDMPMEVPNELPIVGFSSREDPRDVLVLPIGSEKWDKSKPVGCSGKRRIVQIRKLYPEIKTENIRGNVLTRLRKLDEGQYGAIILAAAGLKRLGLENRISAYFEPNEIIPAAGQGILAVQGRRGNDYGYLEGFFDRDAGACAKAERAFVRELDGGCSSPIAAHAIISEGRLLLNGLYCEENSQDYVTGSIEGTPDEAEKLGIILARRLIGGKNGR
jgi:hydroxymethylbilane synthase